MSTRLRLHIEGMTCQACATRLEKVLSKKDFIQSASVNFANEEACIVYDADHAAEEDVLAAVTKSGFRALPAQMPSETESGTMPWRLRLLLLVNIPFAIGMAGMLLGRHDWMVSPAVQFVLASVVQWGLMLPVYRSALHSIRGGLANMDVLVSLGTLAVYLYSSAVLLGGHAAHQHVYFEAGTMVAAMVALGKYWEQRSKQGSLNSLALLVKLTPQTVQVQRDGGWQQLPLAEVRRGDVLQTHSGGRLAADGTVLSGHGWADESHLSGEAHPLEKLPGSAVLAGALLTDGSVVYRADTLGSDTLLGDMMQALAQAQGSKAPIARLADRAAGVFVPAVAAVALLTFALTWALTGSAAQALMHAVAVLVIACPCALGLATPAAVMVGMGQAAKRGIWFKEAAALETAARVDTVVLDKTGTLTEGRPVLAAVYRADPAFGEQELLQAAAAVAALSGHPLAQAVAEAAAARGLSLPQAENVQTLAGQGVSASVADFGEVRLGRADFCGLTALPQEPQWQNASVAAVSIGGRAAGAFALSDRIKADSPATIGRLKAMGITPVIMSGDRPQAVAAVAAQLGIDDARGGMSPRDKAAAIAALRAEGRTVAMVGDGINDSPALAAADVGFAFYHGSSAAVHSAGATLMQHSAGQLADALTVSRATLRAIRQNLFFAFFYNIVGIPLAAFGLLSPLLAGAAMALSSLSVLANALRLKKVWR